MNSLDQLLLNPRTKVRAKQFAEQPPQAIMITGLAGSGKTVLAQALAAMVLSSDDVSNYPYFLHVTRPNGKKDILIENIRQTLHSLRLKTPGVAGIRRVVFIEDAHYMSNEAQNALLKAIEEPADDTAFMLSATSPRAVLPTIASRVQLLSIQPVTLSHAKSFYADKYADKDIESAWQLSQGRTGLLQALLDDSTEHPLKQAVETAKQLLRQNTYQRLLALDKLSKDKEQFSLLLDALGRVLAALQRATIGKGGRQAGLLRSRRLVAELQTALQANTAPRLIALELALKLEI